MNKPILMASLIGLLIISAGESGVEEPVTNQLISAKKSAETVSLKVMNTIYEEVKTPFKYGVVLKGDNNEHVLCPNVFSNNGKWFMVYVSFNGVGYQTHLAESENLIEWNPKGTLLSFRNSGWDQWQVSGGVALMDYSWGSSNTLEKFKDRYWFSYIGGAFKGREPDPLAIGIAYTDNLTSPGELIRVPQNPVLSSKDPDARSFEKMTLYKSNIIWDKSNTLGHPFVMFYNGKIKSGYEKIGIAVSDDMIYWRRYGSNAVVANGENEGYGISGDPQIVKIGDVWVMFYFGAGWSSGGAFDTFACSYDLVNWRKWMGPHLVEPSEPWDKIAAHKPWIIKHDGIVYHFYHAKGNQGQVIGLATSIDLKSD